MFRRGWGRLMRLTGLLLLLGSLGANQACWLGDHDLRIAAGTQGSGVNRIGTAIAEVLSAEVSGVDASVVAPVDGQNSLQRLIAGNADLAIAFSHVKGHAGVRTLIPLYELYLYMIVRETGGVMDVPTMRGRRIGVGPEASGTDTVARRLFGHYGLVSKEGNEVTLVNGRFQDLSKAFLKGELDGVFILGSNESKNVERLLREPGTRMLSLDDPQEIAPVMDGIRTRQPFVVSHVIPRHLFGAKPRQPTGVIGAQALLVAMEGLPDEAARKVTGAVFEHRLSLGRIDAKLGELTELFEPDHLRYPLHPGAELYYQRDKPSFFVEYAEPISLAITVALLGWSGLMAFAAHRRRNRRNLLGQFYREFQDIVGRYDEEHETQLDQMDDATLRGVYDRLQHLRRRTFDSLLTGRMEVSNSLVVFQDYLRVELEKIERMLRDRRGEGAR